MRQTEGYSQWFVNECARAAREGHQKMMRPEGVGEGLYLYFRPGRLELSEHAPSGCELGTPERAPRHLTVEQLTAWVHRNSTRLGCLPPD